MMAKADTSKCMHLHVTRICLVRLIYCTDESGADAEMRAPDYLRLRGCDHARVGCHGRTPIPNMCTVYTCM